MLNALGSKSKRKIIVFESDDWGTIRMSSKNAFNHFLTKGYPVDQCPYNTYDCLESNEDMESLFSVLLNFRDGNQNHPCFTANHVVANPDFNVSENQPLVNIISNHFMIP